MPLLCLVSPDKSCTKHVRQIQEPKNLLTTLTCINNLRLFLFGLIFGKLLFLLRAPTSYSEAQTPVSITTRPPTFPLQRESFPSDTNWSHPSPDQREGSYEYM